MKYPKAGDLQREMSTQLTSNPCGCKHNPFEVRSPSGLEGVFVDEVDAQHEADELRKAGVQGVTVQPREKKTRPRVPRYQVQRNPAPSNWRVSRSVTNMADNIEILGDPFKATSFFKYVGVDVDGVGHGWLHRCYDDHCIVELTDGEVDAYPASKVWPVSGYYPEHRGRARRNPSSQRLFMGITPTGISYADRQRERDGDYMKVAFLPFTSLRLQWEPGNHPPELIQAIREDSDRIIAMRGQPYEVSSSGQTVILGGERRRPTGAPPQFHERQGRPPGVPNPSGKLGDPTSLGTWAAGSRVQLGVWEFPKHAPNGVLVEGDWVTIVTNNATTAGYVVVRDEASGARYERDGRSPLFSVDKARSVRA
jgi:hypothetical protein